jgi:hypothetical protein
MATINLSEIESRIAANEAKVIFNMLKTTGKLKSGVVDNFPSYSKGKVKLELTLKSTTVTYSDGTKSTYQEI